MPEYKIKAPDGRTVTLRGDTPPTEADLDQVFATLPPPAPVQAAPAEPQETLLDKAKGGGRALAQGATFGFADELAGLASGAKELGINVPFMGPAKAQTGSFGERMKRAKEAFSKTTGEERKALEEYKKKNPMTALALEVAGGLPTGGGLVKLGTMAGKTALQKMLAGGAGSALGGALSGAGTSEGGLAERGTGAAVGGVLGAGLGAAGAGLGTVGRKLTEKAKEYVAPTLGQLMGEGAVGQSVRGVENMLRQSMLFGQPFRSSAQKQVQETMRKIEGLSPKASETLEEMGGKVSDAAENALGKIRSVQDKLYQKNVYSKIEGGRHAKADASNVRNFIQGVSKDSPEVAEQMQKVWARYDKPDLNIAQINDFKQQIGSLLNKEGIKMPHHMKIGLYNAAKDDFYNSVRSAAPDELKDSVVRNLTRGDRYYSKVQQSGVGKFLDEFADAPEFQKATMANNLLRSASEGRRESYSKINSLLKRATPEDADIIKQNLIRHTLVPYGKENYEITTKQIAAKFNDIPDKTKRMLFGDRLPEIQRNMKQFRLLGDRPLNPSGTAMSTTDIVALGSLLGLTGAPMDQEKKAKYGAAAFGGALALTRPQAALAALRGIGKTSVAAPAVTQQLLQEG